MIELVQTISTADRHHIVLLTGRDEVCRPQTAAWLGKHHVPYDEMYMQHRHDGRHVGGRRPHPRGSD